MGVSEPDPSPKEIRKMCKKIQKTWTPAQRRHRRYGRLPSVGQRMAGIRIIELDREIWEGFVQTGIIPRRY
jgi:hypothetical protein